jgi:DNA modification methylase
LIRIIHADVIDGLAQIPDQSVQCVVTSPPYIPGSYELTGEVWGLRDYGVDGQIGLEKTPEEFITKMVDVFREVRRVLRDDGTVWLNLGDGYNANTGAGFNGNKRLDDATRDTVMDRPSWLKPKDLVGMPWRVAFALQADGWYLRSDIIWSKPNPMPESVTDRPTKSHEYIFLLTKKPRYFYDADAVREAGKCPEVSQSDYKKYIEETSEAWYQRINNPFTNGKKQDNNLMAGKCPPGGRNRRTVWEIATQPFPGSHFATFPEALVEPCIKAGTSERGCCGVCGAPWVRVVEATGGGIGKSWSSHENDAVLGARVDAQNCKRVGDLGAGSYKRIENGWQPSCTCNADAIPCTVLDPFGGSGTVGKVARDLKRKAILIELNADYIKIARERLRLNEQLGAFA